MLRYSLLPAVPWMLTKIVLQIQIVGARPEDQGRYDTYADNGRGPPVTAPVLLSVNQPRELAAAIMETERDVIMSLGEQLFAVCIMPNYLYLNKILQDLNWFYMHFTLHNTELDKDQQSCKESLILKYTTVLSSWHEILISIHNFTTM